MDIIHAIGRTPEARPDAAVPAPGPAIRTRVLPARTDTPPETDAAVLRDEINAWVGEGGDGDDTDK